MLKEAANLTLLAYRKRLGGLHMSETALQFVSLHYMRYCEYTVCIVCSLHLSL